MTVDEFHTYVVSDLRVWVHNDSCSYKTPKSGVNVKEAAKHAPSQAKGEKPTVGENGEIEGLNNLTFNEVSEYEDGILVATQL